MVLDAKRLNENVVYTYPGCLRDLKLTDRGGHLPPLQHRLLGDAAIGVNIDALVLVTQQQLHPTAAGEDDDGMRPNNTLDLKHTHTHNRRDTLSSHKYTNTSVFGFVSM